MKKCRELLLVLLGGVTGSTAVAATDWNAVVSGRLTNMNSGVAAAARAAPIRPVPREDLTLVLAAARAHWDVLDANTQQQVQGWLLRPTPSLAVGSDEYSWRYRNPEATPIDTTHFRVHYIDKNLYPSDTNAATTAFANSVATELESVWTAEHTTLGYEALPADTSATYNGGNSRFDVYLADIGSFGLYGYVAPEAYSGSTARPYGAYSYMVLDNDYTTSQFGYAEPSDPMKVTIAHEYFHAIQFGYSADEFDAGFAFMEQSATWMEDKVYSTINDNYNYIGEPYVDADGDGQYDLGESYTDHNTDGVRDEGSLEWPESPLDSFDNPGLVQYGRFIWFHFLSQNYGDAIVRTIFEKTGEVSGDNMLAAIGEALVGEGTTFAAAYQEYAAWNYDMGLYDDGANYPLPWTDRVIAATGSANSEDSPSLGLWMGSGYPTQLHLSTIYVRINNPSGSYQFIAAGGTPALTMLVYNGSVFTHQTVMMTSGTGTWTAPMSTSYAIAVISNSSVTEDSMVWNLRPSSSATATAPTLGTVTVSGGSAQSWSGGSVSISATTLGAISFVVSASDDTTPAIRILSNPTTYGSFDVSSNTFVWDYGIAAGTYDVVFRVYDRNDVRQYTDGTVRLVVTQKKKSKKDDGFLGLGMYGPGESLALLLLALIRRRYFL